MQFRDGLTATDADIAAHFDKNKEHVPIGERRKVRYLLLDTQALRNRITPTPAGDRAVRTTQNIEQFSNPEQVRASHILLKTEGKDEAAVRKQAEAILRSRSRPAATSRRSPRSTRKTRRARLAAATWTSSAGDRWCKAFEDVGLQRSPPGQISDLVKTHLRLPHHQGGRQARAGVQPLDEVRDQITEQLKWERAQERATDARPTELDAEI